MLDAGGWGESGEAALAYRVRHVFDRTQQEHGTKYAIVLDYYPLYIVSDNEKAG